MDKNQTMVRPTRYKYIAAPLQSSGAMSMVFPFAELWEHYLERFASHAVDAIFDHQLSKRSQKPLSELGITDSFLELDEWFEHLQDPPMLPLVWEQKDLLRIARACEDYASDNGGWKQELQPEFSDATQLAIEQITSRLSKIIREQYRILGPTTAIATLARIETCFSNRIEQWEDQMPEWEADRSQSLRDAGRRLRGMATPRQLHWRIASRFVAVSPKRWLDERQTGRAAKQIMDDYQSGVRQRYRRLFLLAKRDVAIELLGGDGVQGRLDDIRRDVTRRVVFFDRLVKSFSDKSIAVDNDGSTIVLAGSLNDYLSTKTKRTVADLFDDQLVKAGKSPEKLARRLWEDGLPVGDSKLPPPAWINVEIPVLAAAIRRTVRQELGTTNTKNAICIENPTTALDFAAQVNLAHPEIEPLVRSAVRTWSQKSKPYIQCEAIEGVTNDHRYLFCYGAHRSYWENLLQTEARPLGVSKSTAPELGIRHPFRVLFAQFGFGFPVGKLPTFIQGKVNGQILRKRKGTEPLFDEDNRPELRALSQRADNYEEACKMFTALYKARLLRPVANGNSNRYSLMKLDPTIEKHFRKRIIEAAWKTPQYFHDLLKRADFRSFVEIQYGGDDGTLLGWNETAIRLAESFDSNEVANTLKALGVLEQGEAEQYRLAGGAPKELSFVPQRAFRTVLGDVVGLTRHEIISRSQSDDWFWNVLFWQCVDAHCAERITRTDLPQSVIEFFNERNRSR
jgi:hypothetical protein